MDWVVTKTDGPRKYPKEWRSGDIIIRKGTSRGAYPMTTWRVLYPNGKVGTYRSLALAQEHAQIQAQKNST